MGNSDLNAMRLACFRFTQRDFEGSHVTTIGQHLETDCTFFVQICEIGCVYVPLFFKKQQKSLLKFIGFQ